uniref:Uncharacterized protein n=1 Tax=Anguilla anguilla TaxID=7936 RepID=A0A0E9X2R7_ANGAN
MKAMGYVLCCSKTICISIKLKSGRVDFGPPMTIIFQEVSPFFYASAISLLKDQRTVVVVCLRFK